LDLKIERKSGKFSSLAFLFLNNSFAIQERNHLMTQLSPYIHFNGDCRQAMEFYKQCLGGELHLQTIGGSPIEAECPPGMKDQILHSSLINRGIFMMGSDMNGPGAFVQGNNMAISINCSSEEEISIFFSKLSTGGKIIDDLKEQFWGGLFGVLTDRFGIRWMLNFEPAS
jgi:PhnB protein